MWESNKGLHCDINFDGINIRRKNNIITFTFCQKGEFIYSIPLEIDPSIDFEISLDSLSGVLPITFST